MRLLVNTRSGARRRARVSPRIAALLALLLTATTVAAFSALEPASAHTTNTLHENWAEQPEWDPDPSFSVNNVERFDTTHPESTIVYFRDQWMMFHRRRVNAPGTLQEERYVISRSISNDGGDTWNYAGDVIVPFGGSVGCYSVEAPKVAVTDPFAGAPNGLLTMVYQARPSGPGATCPTPKWNWQIAMAHSTDGATWTNQRIVLTAKSSWEGATLSAGRHLGEIGTPTITRLGNEYWVGYHGFSNLANAKLQRGFARYIGSDPRAIRAADNTGNSRDLIRQNGGNPVRFERQNSSALEDRPAFNRGFGAADIVTVRTDLTGGTHDNGLYMVVEGFENTPFCNDANTSMVIAIARAESFNGPWKVQDRVLLGSFPDRSTGPATSCGRDLPSWQINDGRYKVVLAQDDKTGLQRITLRNHYLDAPPPPTTTTTAPAPKMACENGVDDDGDTVADMADPGCSSPSDNDEGNAWPCSDGADNDQDAKHDWPADPGCTSWHDDNEWHWIPDTLGTDQTLWRGSQGDMLKSADGAWTAWMQPDGNFSLYWHFRVWDEAWTGWHTGTGGTDANQATQQGDGNFVMYGPSRAWCSTWTNQYQGQNPYMRLQNDGNLVIYVGNENPVWDRYGYTGRSQCIW